MSTTAGLDIQRGRPLPSIGATEAKLQQRKLDALKRGVHRIADASQLVHGIHVIGLGAIGAGVVEKFLAEAPETLLDAAGSRLTALAVDVDGEALARVRRAPLRFDTTKAHVETVALEVPKRSVLEETLSRYTDFLKLEYPLYHPNPDSTRWLPDDGGEQQGDGHPSRAMAKALYGRAFYDGERPMLQALKRFARSVEATQGDALVCIVFGLADATGSAIAMDLSRHLSAGIFGRRVLVTGMGIAPHADDQASNAGSLHTVMSELDVLCDETKNRGITASCGEQFRNPFTAGFVVVPQPPDLDIADARNVVQAQVVSLLSQRKGANLWEALRLLNWVAAPSTQHSAARTPWGARWIHMLAFGDENDAPDEADLRRQLGLRSSYVPEFIELRLGDETPAARPVWQALLDEALQPQLPTQLVTGGPRGSVQFVLPRMARSDLAFTAAAKAAYEAVDPKRRRMQHALLLDQGLVLCEPSSSLEGMAGANLGSGQQWIAVPLDRLDGNE